MKTCNCKTDHGVSSTGYCPNCGGAKPLSADKEKLLASLFDREKDRLAGDLKFSADQGTDYAVMTSQEAVRDILAQLSAAKTREEALRGEVDVLARDSGLYRGTLFDSAKQLGCDEHMVDHAVKDLLAKLTASESEVAGLRAALEDIVNGKDGDKAHRSIAVARAALRGAA
jgi:hypothetical protein